MPTVMMKCSKCGIYFIGVKVNPASIDICYDCEPVIKQFTRVRNKTNELINKMKRLQEKMFVENKA